MKSFLKDTYHIVRPGGVFKALFFIVILGELTSTYTAPENILLGLAWVLFCMGALALQTWLYRIFNAHQASKIAASKTTPF